VSTGRLGVGAFRYRVVWNYYGLIGNSEGRKEFFWQAGKLDAVICG
jgi:hypothetical protein